MLLSLPTKPIHQQGILVHEVHAKIGKVLSSNTRVGCLRIVDTQLASSLCSLLELCRFDLCNWFIWVYETSLTRTQGT